MNVFFRLGKWWEDHRSIKKVEFEERLRQVEVAVCALQNATGRLIDNAPEIQAMKQAIRTLQKSIK